MLRFSRRPDCVFHAIVSEALDQAIDSTKFFRDGDVLSQQDKRGLQEWYEASFPRTASLLTSEEAVAELERLRDTHLDTNTLSQLTDYHWLLLYESISPVLRLSQRDNWLRPDRANRY
jgi:hypothetical protein